MFTGYADIKAVMDAINQRPRVPLHEKPWDPEELPSWSSQAAGQYSLLAENSRPIRELSAANKDLLPAC